MKPMAVGGKGRGLLDLLENDIGPIVCAGASGVEQSTWDRALIGLARQLLERPGKQFRARLVERAFCLAGGAVANLDPRVPQLVELLHAGSLIVDDIQDDSPIRRGAPALHVVAGMPLALNTGNWLYFAAFELAGRLDFDDRTSLALHKLLATTLFRCHQGQALDLSLDVTEVRQRDVARLVDAVASLKTGALVGFAGALGAMAANASDDERDSLAEFGAALGVGLQQLDDFGGVVCSNRAEKGLEDLASGRPTWSWAYLSKHLDEVRFASLQSRLRQARSARGGARRSSLKAIAAELAELQGDDARLAVGARLRDAMARLAAAFPTHPTLTEVSDEIARLELSYG